MKLTEISRSASALANQIKAGIPVDQAIGRLAILQPRHAEFWQAARHAVQAGGRTSDILKGHWPEAFVSALRAGERAGRLADVLGEINRSIKIEIAVVGMMRKLLYPLGLVVAGMTIFFGFMAFVLPAIGKSIPEKDRGAMFKFADALEYLTIHYWWAMLGALVGGGYLLYSWLSTTQGQQALLDFVVSMPFLSNATRDLYFGLWANQMALMAGAGIRTTIALENTAASLPSLFASGILKARDDIAIHHRKMTEAFDPEKQPPDDPRHLLPFYIINAFIIAEQTGDIEQELLRAAPAMIEDGMAYMETAISYANLGATMLAATFIVSPLGLYYMQVFSVISAM